MPLWFRIVRSWLPVALVATALVGFTYVAVQQVYRNGADDPQVQMAEDAAARLDAGDAVADVLVGDPVNMSASLAPFLIVYDAHNQVIAGTGVLNGASPVPPIGVLDTARAATRDRVTWQPADGVRIASVSAATRDGRVVLAGRSLREAERHVADLGPLALAGWIAALLGGLVVVAVIEIVGRRWDASA
jgi:hypothetical protein